MARAARPTDRLRALAIDLGAVLLVFALATLLEYIAVAGLYKHLLTGAWETVAIRNYVIPVAAGILFPTGIALLLLGRLAARAPEDPVARRLLAGGAVIAASALAWGVSGGRRMASAPLRTAFVLVLALGAGFAVFTLAPRLARWPKPRLAALGACVALGAWMADVVVLPRLYPAFHAALFLVFLAGVATVAVVVPTERRGVRIAALVAIALNVAFLAGAKLASRALTGYDNLRLVLVERAPLLGRAVKLAASMAPPILDDQIGDGIVTAGVATSARAPALDFRGRDVLLVSIDALRADHVGAYGYERPTTPHIDRLAKDGVRFEAAYSPTPHTSYAVTSMMTGKYMRPLLALGLGADSDTWAGLMRHYGYRTAAFYPPAVFFIDESAFASFRDRGLDFEYRKVEFAAADLRAKQIEAYLASVPAEQPLFLWTHFFEPHEPYVAHADHVFGDPAAPKPVDAYDSEVAAADAALGTLVDAVRKRRPNVVVIVTADHGEEFGDHGGRYHGTSVYDEQVRVPLVVSARGLAPGVVRGPVQTIDLLPTVLSALHVPRPARLRGRDLGPELADLRAREGPESVNGFAFSETEDHTMIAEGRHRQVCSRSLGACALYDVAHDPLQRRDVAASEPAVAARLKKRAAELSRSHGRLEQGATAGYPEALRRALQGDREAALEVAPLLDDVRADLRRATGRALFELAVPETIPFARRGLADADEEARDWCALVLVRLGVKEPPLVDRAVEILARADADWRFRAALALAEAGDARGVDVLAARLEARTLSFAEERAVIRVIATLKDKRGVKALVAALPDVRLRPIVAEALGQIGDVSAKPALLRAFEAERYVSMREIEARALLALGARRELEAGLVRFAGVPEPWPVGLDLAEAAGLLRAPHGGLAPAASVTVSAGDAADGKRLYVAAPDGGAASVVELGPGKEVTVPARTRAFWLVPRAEEIPPPPPVPWDAGPD